MEARRQELIRAVTGEDEAVVRAPGPGAGGLWSRRALLAAGIFAGACVLGLGVAWVLTQP